ncbi:hypothetical protein CJD36_006170 [Flavipsychrobacter stenotrophus]|uniref:AB hydrolase-1 domain-containing protein n=1 Tax=Flavipsychrobacter stenotrophus TaxID=2077091 RepID=A0A2S7SXB9_9BACT|nr:alpha/beta hydrolase [Flavipsychrobacter stenotrophus]PQJ11384.1 hypothetical protein CJD36_006170 [Flavipsychrobacter stenotrophus]
MSTRAKLILAILTFLFYCHMALAQNKYDAFTVKVSGKGQPVILIPGATCSGAEWDETIAHWNGKYQTHAITIAGYAGTAPMAGGPYLDKVRTQIEQYIADNKLKDVILVGHSIGGFLALSIGMDMNSSLSRIVVVDAMPFFAGANNPNAADTFSEAQAKGILDRYTKMDDQQLKASQMMITKFMCLDSTRWDMIATWGQQSDKRTMAYTMSEMLGKDIRKDIARIKVPVLVLAAYSAMPQYPQFTRESVAKTFGDQYKACTQCTVHVADGKTRHFIMYDNPLWFYKEMDTFLQKNN